MANSQVTTSQTGLTAAPPTIITTQASMNKPTKGSTHISTSASTSITPILPLWKRLIYSGLAGAIATTCIYPLDITKTKLQDQRKGKTGPVSYAGPLDCAKKIIQADGLKGLYRGWPPNVLLVMPEKALKITANEQFRAMLNSGPVGTPLPLPKQILAGGLAGFVQVFVTCPMELLKIQGATMKDKFLRGEIPRMKPYTELAKDLGFAGLYTGVVSTWLRDVPFSFVYFPIYYEASGYLKKSERFKNATDTTVALAAGAIAGTGAAAITTPLDVIKTRVHANARRSDIPPGLGPFFRKEVSLVKEVFTRTLKEEGPSAFFKGVVPRVLIISPLFGITMTMYQKFVSIFD